MNMQRNARLQIAISPRQLFADRLPMDRYVSLPSFELRLWPMEGRGSANVFLASSSARLRRSSCLADFYGPAVILVSDSQTAVHLNPVRAASGGETKGGG